MTEVHISRRGCRKPLTQRTADALTEMFEAAHQELTLRQATEALTVLQHATEHLTAQFSVQMTRDEAQAHFDARALLLNKGIAVFNTVAPLTGTAPISKKNLDAAVASVRQGL